MALADNALTTIATCEAELSLTASAQDALLTRYINTASDQIERYIGRKLYNGAAVVENIPGSGDALLFVSRTPLNSITSIVDASGNTVSSGDYSIWDADQGAIYNGSGWNHYKVSQTDYDRYVVTFDGGWVTPKQGGTRTLPFDIEGVCVDMVTIMWRQKGADRTVQSESVLSTSVTYRQMMAGVTPSMMAVLDSYRRMDGLADIH